ncbi:unnamed protein product [Aspergillus oryzae]|uniref:Unnamed protein product n=2 Tax=Aspergillus oryzae TaxID=5062 RepID=A0AAN4YFN7_ASPOZ|nr:unnamed protein product [Aspergillus oryzae]GMF94468.1 unnamed protein product [Aspergillus oryzae]GMG25518.1 unnamed protein product [Aspergillus oryzae]GMG47238.1 unnamed protein product [Aspergillus oryzae var. brunneus]
MTKTKKTLNSAHPSNPVIHQSQVQSDTTPTQTSNSRPDPRTGTLHSIMNTPVQPLRRTRTCPPSPSNKTQEKRERKAWHNPLASISPFLHPRPIFPFPPLYFKFPNLDVLTLSFAIAEHELGLILNLKSRFGIRAHCYGTGLRKTWDGVHFSPEEGSLVPEEPELRFHW